MSPKGPEGPEGSLGLRPLSRDRKHYRPLKSYLSGLFFKLGLTPGLQVFRRQYCHRCALFLIPWEFFFDPNGDFILNFLATTTIGPFGMWLRHGPIDFNGRV